jgi:hypothetical protein
MARTINEIYNELITAKESQPDLTTLTPLSDTADDLKSDLTSNSVVAVWRLWLWIVAVGSHTVELLIDKHRSEVETFVANKEWGTLAFLRQKALEFQIGYSLTFNGSQFVYSVTDTDAQIVKRSAVVVSGQTVQFKIAKLNISGLPEKLTSPEKSSFISYIDGLVYAGTQYVVISDDPDDIKLDLEIVFDPLVLSDDGSLINDGATFPIIDAINEFISNLPFNGVLNLTALIDKLQAVDGVVDPVLNQAFAKYGGFPYLGIDKNLTPFAGHAILDEINSTITFTNKNSI